VSESPEDEHKRLLRTPLKVTCRTDIFTPEEMEALERYGSWMESLAFGRISPTTPAQVAFIAVYNGTPAQTFYERLWVKYRAQMICDAGKKLEGRLATGELEYWQVHQVFRKAAYFGCVEANEWLQSQKEGSQPAVSEADGLDMRFPKTVIGNQMPMHGFGGTYASRKGSGDEWGPASDDFGPEN